MNCPECGHSKQKVPNTNGYEENEIVRKRVCVACGHVFYTAELIVDELVVSWTRRGEVKKGVPVLVAPVKLVKATKKIEAE